MARRVRATFGRLPKAAPDLTNAIVALVREAQAQTDQNIVDAWKNGGKVEGKGVDDDRLLAHMKERRDQLSPEDPGWDEWNDNYIQYDFAINESKMALKNDEGKVSDAEMANFYRKWAGREDVQKNSEFYRTLLSNAAKWNAAAKQRSAGNGARAKAEAHSKWVDGYYDSNVKPGETLNVRLLEIAKTMNVAPQDANSLDDIKTNSPDYGRFLDIIDDGKSDDPFLQGLITSTEREIKGMAPGFKWGQSGINDLLDRGDRGLKRLGQEATSDTERNGWANKRSNLRYEKTRITPGSTAAQDRINNARDTYIETAKNCHGNPFCAKEAAKTLRDRLVGEVPNVVAGQGGGKVTLDTQDTKQANSVLNTIRQLDDIVAGKKATVNDPRTGPQSPAESLEDYTIFDDATGAQGATGWLQKQGNFIFDDADTLAKGGWVETRMVQGEGGAPQYDGNGEPMYEYQVWPATVPPPPGAVAVAGSTQMTDRTQTVPGAMGAGTPLTVSPTTYVLPSGPSLVYTDPSGQSISPGQTKVQMFEDAIEVGNPWMELRGVKGPDGVAHTLYRTGSGSADSPYLFHDVPPVPATATRNAAGQFVVPTVPTTDEKGNPSYRADVGEYMRGVVASRTQNAKTGNYTLGTYETSGASAVSTSMRTLFSDASIPSDKKASLADKYFREYATAVQAIPSTVKDQNGVVTVNKDRVAADRDLAQLNTTVGLWKTGRQGSALGTAYDEAALGKANPNANRDKVLAAGFGKYGEAEVQRRVSLLTGIDDADQRLAARKEAGAPNPNPGTEYGKRGLETWKGDIASYETDLATQRKNIFNPSISVSAIKVPGMPTIFGDYVPPGYTGQGTFAPGQNIPVPAPVLTTPGAPGVGAGGPNPVTPKKPETKGPVTVVPDTKTPDVDPNKYKAPKGQSKAEIAAGTDYGSLSGGSGRKTTTSNSPDDIVRRGY